MPRQRATRSAPKVSLDSYVNSVSQEKAYFTFRAGLNTDASPLAFPDNFSLDEENFVLNIDGSRNRRLGLALETGGEAVAIQDTNPGVVRAFHWRNVAGNPLLNFCVIQNGTDLLFFEDDSGLVTSTQYLGAYSLLTYKTSGTTDAEVATSPINVDYGRGHLFVTGSVIEPFYVEYDEATTSFVFNLIDIEQRDFEGIDDGISVTAQPTDAIDSHIYNLKNSGWRQGDITTYVSEKSKYPSKSMIPWMGMAGQTTTDVAETDWTKQFSADKIDGELFADTPAPNGKFIHTIWNKQIVVGSSASYVISTWSIADVSGSSTTMHIQLDADHGLVTNDSVYVSGHLAFYYGGSIWGGSLILPWGANGLYDDVTVATRTITAATNANPAVFTCANHGLLAGDRVTLALTGGTWNTLDGDVEITSVTTDTFTITGLNGTSLGSFTSGTAVPLNCFEIPVDPPDMSGGWYNQYYMKGNIWTEYEETSETGLSKRPALVAFFAGRVWYAGVEEGHLSPNVYFSQVVTNDNQYGKCYQAADPTSQYISDLVDTDGGVISIPEMDAVREILPYNGKLLVFADNGVWEIGGGRSGYFTATDYSVRQVSNVGCSGGMSVIVAEGTPYYWGQSAIYAIEQDPYQGFLFSKDITTGRIQALVKSVPKNQKEHIQATYDKSSQCILWFYNTSSTVDYSYPNWLVFDLGLDAFSKHSNKSSTYKIRGAYDIEYYQETSNEQRNIKFLCDTTARDTLYISELNDESFEDFGTDAAAYVETGHDGMGDVSRRHYGRYLFTYMERTENFAGDNPSECYVRYLWSWVDSSSDGSWNTQRSVYRPLIRKYRNPYIPSDPNALMGEPVAVSRTKIRGTGKVLRLRYDTEAGKHCRLYGWQLRQDINVEA